MSELKGDVILEVMARVDKRREEFIAADTNAAGTDNAAVDSEENNKLPPDGK